MHTLSYLFWVATGERGCIDLGCRLHLAVFYHVAAIPARFVSVIKKLALIYWRFWRLKLICVTVKPAYNGTARDWQLFSVGVFPLIHVQGDSFGTRPKKMRISQRLFIRFWTCIYDYIPSFMRSMSIIVCRCLTSWRDRDNDWLLAPCHAQPCHCVVR